MKIVFHERYTNSRYAGDPAAAAGRLEPLMDALSRKGRWDVVTPGPAAREDILRAHGGGHYETIKANPLLYELAALAAGGAIQAAEIAAGGEAAFAVIRPPGHHASATSCWGFCFFNNMSVALLKLFSEGSIKSAFVLDFDLHTGDGNINILAHRNDGFRVTILNPMAGERDEYLREVDAFMRDLGPVDIFAASAGFDQGLDDWGGLLAPEDYEAIGALMKEHSERTCGGRRFAILEGGYNHEAMAINALAFCEGFA